MFLQNNLHKGLWFAILFFSLLSCKKNKNQFSSINHFKKDKMPTIEIATFAGGCFWCMEKPYEEIQGIIKAEVGYSGKDKLKANYENVSSGKTKYLEAVQITFDARIISYTEVVEIFWQQIDPTDEGGQFADRGNHYKTAIFYHNEQQKREAIKSKEQLQQSGKFKTPIVTEIVPFENFYLGEEYHQDYYKKNPLHYQSYRKGSGREDFLKETWGKEEKSSTKKSKEELKKKLTPLQYYVTQENGTEPAFENTYWNHREEGLYVDIVSGEVLFSSKEKYDSGCGWPSFDKSIASSNIVFKEDNSHGMKRIEVRSKNADSHLGHIFDDGPKETTGKRYCINSAAIRFIKKENLQKEGYGDWLHLFKD